MTEVGSGNAEVGKERMWEVYTEVGKVMHRPEDR